MQTSSVADPGARGVESATRRPHNLVGIRSTVELGALHTFPRLILPVMTSALRRTGKRPAGPPTAVFRPRVDGTFEVTAGYPTVGRHVLGRPFTSERLPGGDMVQIMHCGSWSTLLFSYDRLNEWLSARRVSLVSLMWEEYVVGPDLVADSAAWRTRIVVPLPARPASRSAACRFRSA
ncbi:hypothetical protein ADL15_46185 [Actinoplanes awajinensis subsp. mycoplanecinus]|uniref:GyrI-like small molecule binding domain-containing protein n=1 Tax=Actinoplanes awajinensis subsp. mycoplanecinus TaxID=135947 RepID=A0A117MLC1_9ACTN|nr:hypothetical protein ADL15_46185 [Actinoplanes awajinensis subsp. mycoplanecinus]